MMQSFTDANKNAFTLNLTYGTVQRVQAELGLDLRYPSDPDSTEAAPKPSLVSRLFTDPFLFVSLLMVLIRDQFDANKMPAPDGWRDGIDGDTIGKAREAFFKEWEDFFHGLKTPHLAETMRAEMEWIRRGAEAGAAELRAMDPAALIKKKIASTLTASSGSGPGSSELTHAA